MAYLTIKQLQKEINTLRANWDALDTEVTGGFDDQVVCVTLNKELGSGIATCDKVFYSYEIGLVVCMDEKE